MITRADADDIAAGWARRESVRRGYECTPMVAEFDLGYVVWTRQPASVLPMPGDGATTVIDRETGRLSHWPNVPSTVVEEMYRERRAAIVDPPKTADPEVELRRNARRRVSPAVAAHVTLDGRLFIARGAKGDQELRHHALVLRWLQQTPPGRLVRGVERHAELIVLSDVLHEVDRIRAQQGAAPVTLDEARAMLRDAQFETFHIRETGDPLGGRPAPLCESCIEALADVALVRWSHLGRTIEWPAREVPNPEPGRFPDEVAWVLADGGWKPRRRDSAEIMAEILIEQAVAVPGREHRHEPFPAAFEAFCSFDMVTCGRKGPGAEQRIRLFDLNAMASVHTADMLFEFGALIGARLFPVGAENYGETLLAVDEHGRIFAFDQGGEWFIGDTLDAALITLLTGGHTPRVHDDGTW
jgi:hypothetical protein